MNNYNQGVRLIWLGESKEGLSSPECGMVGSLLGSSSSHPPLALRSITSYNLGFHVYQTSWRKTSSKAKLTRHLRGITATKKRQQTQLKNTRWGQLLFIYCLFITQSETNENSQRIKRVIGI